MSENKVDQMFITLWIIVGAVVVLVYALGRFLAALLFITLIAFCLLYAAVVRAAEIQAEAIVKAAEIAKAEADESPKP